MKYDIKIYEKGEERETIRDLKYSQKEAIVSVLARYGIKFQVREVREQHPRWKAEWHEWVLPAVITVMWAVACAVVSWEKPLVLIFTLVAAGVAVGIVYLVAWRSVFR